VVDGRRVVWAGSGADGLYQCEISPTGVCDASPLVANHALLEPVALSERWLALIGFAADGLSIALFACEVDFGRGSCDAREIATFPSNLEATADVSGRRLVWHGAGAHGQPDVFTCALGAGAECDAYALTNDAASQIAPRVDGDRLVWIDDRDGIPRVVSFDLGEMRPPPGRARGLVKGQGR
jgi:beta propeller repeat protein